MNEGLLRATIERQEEEILRLNNELSAMARENRLVYQRLHAAEYRLDEARRDVSVKAP